MQTADEWFLVALEDFDDLSVNLLGATLLGKEADLHLVAWERMHRVVVIDTDSRAVRQIHIVAPAVGAGERAFAHLCVSVVGKLAVFVHHDVLTVNHLIKHIDAKHLERMRREFQRLEELFWSEICPWVQTQEVAHGAAQFLLADFRPRSGFFLRLCHKTKFQVSR